MSKSPIVETGLEFTAVKEFKGIKIICISGIDGHFLAVSKEGFVFERGNNNSGQLGLKRSVEKSSFFEIQSLGKYKIRAAYSCVEYSLFEIYEGRVLLYNYMVQLSLMIMKTICLFMFQYITVIICGASICIECFS